MASMDVDQNAPSAPSLVPPKTPHRKDLRRWKSYNGPEGTKETQRSSLIFGSTTAVDDLAIGNITEFVNYFTEQGQHVISSLPSLDGPDDKSVQPTNFQTPSAQSLPATGTSPPGVQAVTSQDNLRHRIRKYVVDRKTSHHRPADASSSFRNAQQPPPLHRPATWSHSQPSHMRGLVKKHLSPPDPYPTQQQHRILPFYPPGGSYAATNESPLRQAPQPPTHYMAMSFHPSAPEAVHPNQVAAERASVRSTPSPASSNPTTPPNDINSPDPKPIVHPQHSPHSTLQTPPSVSADATGIYYDESVLQHRCTCSNDSAHSDYPARLHTMLAHLHDSGLLARCRTMRPRAATRDQIRLVHSDQYLHSLETLAWGPFPSDTPLVPLPCGGQGLSADTYWGGASSMTASIMACGCAVDAACAVASGELRNALALVRPPGMQASRDGPGGGCYLNNVAIAARVLRDQHKVDRIAIIDWDACHGKGTQSIFYEDTSVLYISMHRYDGGSQYPHSGGLLEVGAGEGTGYTINIPWDTDNQVFGDAEYLAAMRTVVLPVVASFAPTVVLVSAGFNAAEGDNEGFTVSPEGYAYMTHLLMSVCHGRVVFCLEGGSNGSVLSSCVSCCMRTLLGSALPPLPGHTRQTPPSLLAVQTLQRVIEVHSPRWPALNQSAPFAQLSVAQAEERERGGESTVTETAEVLALLSMATPRMLSSPGSGQLSYSGPPPPAGYYVPNTPAPQYAHAHGQMQTQQQHQQQVYYGDARMGIGAGGSGSLGNREQSESDRNDADLLLAFATNRHQQHH